MSAHRLRLPLAMLLLAALTVASFAGVAGNQFITLDDQGYVTHNPMVRRGLSFSGAVWAFTTTEMANWHPLTWLSHMLDVQLFGMNPGAHHLVSLAIHVASALLLLLLFLRLTGALWPSALVAALFAVHPLHVESVAWAAERKDVLATLLELAAMLAYLRAARRNAVLGSILTPLLFALALLAKPMPVTLPFLLLLLDWWPLGRFGIAASGAASPTAPPLWRFLPPARLWLEKAPLFLLAAASAAATLDAQARGGAVVSRAALPFFTRVVNALLSYVNYLVKCFRPTDLAIYYPHPAHLPAWHLWTAAFLLLAALSIVAALGARRRPWMVVGWAWYLGALVPVIGFVQAGAQAMADRYTYLPLTGIFLALAWSAARSTEDRPALRRPAAAAAVTAVIVLAILTSRQVTFWRDNRTLFTHALALTGENAVAQNGMGVWFSAEGRFAEALSHYREAVRLNPWSAEFVFNRGTALDALGDLPGAETAFRRALDLDPLHVHALNNLGIVLGKLGRREEAVAAYLRVLEIDPGLAQAHFNLGVILASRGMVDEAIDRYRIALELDPGSIQAHTNLGVELAGRGSYREAAAHFRAAVSIEPANAAAHDNLGKALAELGDRRGAIAELRQALALDPGLTEVERSLRRLGAAESP